VGDDAHPHAGLRADGRGASGGRVERSKAVF
jgi:hypothetical protein